MPSTPRSRDAATAIAVVLAFVLALAWLRSSDDGAPAVPVGLSVATLPPVVPVQPAPADATGRRRPSADAEGAGGGHAAREARRRARQRRRAARAAKQRPAGRKTRDGRDDRTGVRADARPPSGGGTAPGRSASGRTSVGRTSAPSTPEFALE